MILLDQNSPEYAEGVKAHRAGIKATDCPYSFIKTPHYPKDYEGFNRNFRFKLDQWMAGWIAEQKKIPSSRKGKR